MSMGCTDPGDRVSGNTGEQAYTSLKPAIDAHPDREFFIYCATGDEKADGVGTPLRTEISFLSQQTEFQYGTNIEAGDNLYLQVTDFKHTDLMVHMPITIFCKCCFIDYESSYKGIAIY